MIKMLKKVYHGFIYLIVICAYFISFPLAFLLYKKHKYWIISEVDFDARDNGIHFFKYLRNNHHEINCAYLIDKRNPNYEYVKSIGKVIKPHSYKHMLVFIAARAKISTCVHGCSPSWCVTKHLLKHHGTGKNIALKHGIFKNLHPNYFNENAHLDLICCGGKLEFEFISKEFGYKEGVARYTGLARFDGLHNLKTNKIIFIMPTWRRWLDKVNSDDEFKKTSYYQNWFGLLNDSAFLQLAKFQGYKTVFYVHPKLNKFINSFNNHDVVFLNSKNGDSVQEYLRDSSIMITDFSSVFFDFAYMRKPAIYFQFDEDEYFKSHYIKAYFDYRENGFGPVCLNSKDVIKELEKIVLDNNGNMEKVFLDRAVEFFPLYDMKNCERIYQAIVEVIK